MTKTFSLPTILFLAISLATVGVATAPFGVGVTSDTVNYLVAAESLRTEGTLTQFNGAPLLLWPPLYSMLIAALLSIGVPPLEALRCLTIAGLLGTGFALQRILTQLQVSTTVAFLVPLIVALSPSISKVTIMGWTDTLFVALYLGCVALFLRWTTRPPSYRALALTGLVVGLAPLLRLIGVSLIPVAGIALGVGIISAYRNPVEPRRTYRESILQFSGKYLCFSALALLPLLLWLIRNYLVSGSLFGPRPDDDRDFREIFLAIFSVFGRWAAPLGVNSPSFPPLTGTFLYLIPLGALAVWRSQSGRQQTLSSKDHELTGQFVVLGGAIVSYLFVLSIAMRSTEIDAVPERYLVPVLPLVLIIVVCSARYITSSLRSSGARWAWIATTSLFTLFWVFQSVRWHSRQWAVWNTVGAGGFNRRELRAIVTPAPPPGVAVISNGPEQLWFFSKIRSVRGLSPKHRQQLESEQRPFIYYWYRRSPESDRAPSGGPSYESQLLMFGHKRHSVV